MRYLSVFSGIEAATVAWHPLGWTAVGYAEVDPFASMVLHHHYSSGRPMFMPDPAGAPDIKEQRRRRAAIRAVKRLPERANGVPNFGDATQFHGWPDAVFDVLVGGSPCQSFSIAGLRGGLADPRGNLLLTYLAILERYRPEWMVWENVPGAFSVDNGQAFGALVRGLAELGYHAAWRVLDAQYVRVDGLTRAVPQRRRRVFVVGHLGDWRRATAVLFERECLQWDSPPRREARQGLAQNVAGSLGGSSQSGGFRTTDLDNQGAFIPEIVTQAMSSKWHKGTSGPAGDEVANLLAFTSKDYGGDALVNVSPTLRAAGHTESHANGGVMPAIAFKVTDWAVRRLTPWECERLQGFPTGYTDIPASSDSGRYKVLGNSMAVNVMRWIGARIEMVSRIKS